jgi:hypothetical protein
MSIPRWHNEIVEIVCIFRKSCLLVLWILKVHLLVHLVEDIQLVSVVSCRWMFFLERYMKTLKGFVRQ